MVNNVATYSSPDNRPSERVHVVLGEENAGVLVGISMCLPVLLFSDNDWI